MARSPAALVHRPVGPGTLADGSRNSNGSSWNTDSGESYYIRVNGTARTAPPLLSVADASGSEGGDITFTATLSAASGRTVTATWTASVESGDTAAGGDLSGTLTGTLTFAPGEDTRTFTVATAEDTTDEFDGTFTVRLSGPANAMLGDATATGTIVDDDDPPTLRVGSVGILEGQTVIFTPTLSAASGKTVTATWTASVESGDTAEPADLRGTLTGTLSFDPGETSQRIFVSTAEDSLDEGYETFTVTVTEVVNATVTEATGQGGINDNDAAPTLRIADASGSEGGDIAFTATLSAASGRTVRTTWTASVESGDTAASGDLSGALTGTLTFAPGDLTRTFTVATAEDTDDESDETFTVTLSGLSNATLTGGAATGTIEDNEAARTLRIADASGSEGGDITFTVTLEPASVRTVTANWTAYVAVSDTATTRDLTPTSGSLSFSPGETEKTFTVATTQDTTDEDDETFTVALSGLANAILRGGQGEGTIIDDDDPPTLRVGSVGILEGQTVTFTPTLSAASGKTVTATWTASVESGDTAESADLRGALTGTLTFDPGETSQSILVATVDDSLDEVYETFTVTVTEVVNATVTEATGRGGIIDNDAAPTLSVADASGSEGNDIAFTATLAAASGKRVTATWTASVESGDTATSGELSGALTGTLTFAPGDLTSTFTVATVEDRADESDETFTVTLSGLSNATLTGGAATGTIVDDDSTPTLRVADASGSEGDDITFTVTLTAASGRPVTVGYVTYIGTSDTATRGDLTPKSGSLSFAPGDTEKTFTVPTTEDALDEPDETFSVRLTRAANATLRSTTAQGTIVDDDDTPTLSVADASREEGGGITFTATLSAASAQTVTATWTASVESGDTAASGDLTGTLTGALTFAPREVAKTFTVATAEDTVAEPDETFTVTLSNLSNATLTGGTATGTIEDDDGAPVLRIADASAAEGIAIAFTVRLSPASAQTVTVNYATSLESGDTATAGEFTAKSGSLSFAPGDTEKTFTVPTAEDPAVEFDETFTVTLSGPANATLRGATATGTIIDDDDPPTLSVADADRSEGGRIVFTATLSAASVETVKATWTASVERGDTATSDDLSGRLTGRLTFAPGEATSTFTVAIAEDRDDESDETFTVTLTRPENATLGDATATGTIIDDDPQPTLRIADASGSEGDGVAFTVTLSAASSRTVTVVWTASVESGDTAARGDLTGTLRGALTIAPGDRTGTFTVATAEDATDEFDETFTVTLTGLLNTSLRGGPGEGTIVDDDDPPTLSVADAGAVEGDAASFTATLSAVSEKPVTATWTASVESGDTAASGDLIGTLTGTLTFDAGDRTRTFRVATAEDRTDEDDETFTLTLTGVANAAMTDATAQGTIVDDDAAPALRIADASGSEGDGVTFTATLSPASGKTVRVNYATSVESGDTATAGDFTAKSGSLSFGPGDTEKTFRVVTAEDRTDEFDETFTVTLSEPANATLGGATATGTIEDGDDPPTLSVADASGSEGGGITFRATLSAASAKPVTATWTASVGSGDTAASGDLSGALTGTLTFDPGEPARTFTVATAQDTTDEDDETFTVTLSGPANATLGDATAQGAIVDDDEDVPPTLSVADASGSEGGAVSFTATLSAAIAKTVTATWTASVVSGDTAESADLRGRLTGTLTFAPGEDTRTFTVATVEDTSVELDETFTVTLSNLSSATLTGGTATGTIEDDDGAPVLRIADASAAEGGDITFTVRLSPATGQTVTVDYATLVATSDTATAGDFTAASGSLSFGPGDTEKTFTVATAGDAVDEFDETFTVALLAGVSATVRGGQVKGTIVDDDDPPTLSVADAGGSEGDAVSFTATLAAASEKPVTATWTASVESGDTAAGGDLSGALTGTLTFAPGALTRTFTVATAEDTTDEGDETFTVTLSNLANATLTGGAATGTIEDEDAVVGLRIADLSREEGSVFTFTVRLDRATGRTVTANYVAYATARDTAGPGDFTVKSGSLSFSPGETEKTITVATAQDTTDEVDETFTVALSALSNAVLLGGQAKGTIIDNDNRPGLSIAHASGSEGDDITFTVTLEPASGKTVTVNYLPAVEAGDTATTDDFTTTRGLVSFSPGETEKTFTVATTEDALVEGDEIFTVRLGYLSNATVTGGKAIGTIEDDDGAPVLRIADASAAEGSAITFTATLEPASAQTVTVDYATSVAAGDTAATGDFTAKSGSLSFAPGDTEKTFSVVTAGDAVDEHDETFTVTLSGPANATLRGATATGTIIDDDDLPRLSIADASAAEGSAITFTATLEPASGRTVTANWRALAVSGDTAARSDLSGTLTGSLIFAPGEVTKTITVATAEDTVAEDDETFTVRLRTQRNTKLGGGGRATGTIEDDDRAVALLRIADASAVEGNAIAFPVTLAPASGQTVTVNYTAFVAVSDTAATDDFTAKTGSLSFAPGDTEKTLMVATTGDAVDEPDETFTVALSGPAGATLGAATATGTIEDDDLPALSVADASGSEGGDIAFTATLSPASVETVTATWTASVGSRDTAAGGDLSGPRTGTLTFAPGEVTRTFTVATAEDTLDESDETFTVTLLNLSNATLTGGAATGTIVDDDGPPTLSIADASAAEGSAIAFTVTLAPASGQTVTVDYATYVTARDTAATDDFTAASGSLSFSPGETEKTFTVVTAGDAVDEPNETFTVALLAPVNARLRGGEATGTIIEDGDPPTLSVADGIGLEGGGITFTAALSALTAKTVTATWTASVESGDTAASGDLSGTLTGTLTFAPGDRTESFTVATAADALDEEDETFTVTLTGLSNATLTGGTATGTIEDDETPRLSVADAGAAEGDAVSFTVTLAPASAETVTATWTASVESGDTAASGDLSGTLTGTLTFAPGEGARTFTVATAEDTTDEEDESFTVTLSNLSNARLTGGTATGTIEDDDGAPVLRIADASAAEGSAIAFTATLEPASAKTVTVNYATSVESGDTATAGDFTAKSGSLSFGPGETEKTFTVVTTGDAANEDDETFTVTLSGPANATLGDATATGTIEDDDGPPTLRIADASGSEGGDIAFTATLWPASARTVTATWTASVESGDTAASGDLSGTLTGTLTFAPGDLTRTFTVATAADTVDEDDETFTVTLSNLSNAMLGNATAQGTIVDDDAAPVLRIADASGSEGSAITFTVTLASASTETLEPPSAKTVTVNYATSVATGDTAATGDFTAKSGTLSFAPGDTEKTFTVVTAGDAVDEANETFTVTLSGPANATLRDATATGTIDDNDDPPRLSVADASRSEGGDIIFTATLSPASGQTATATWTASVESGDTAASGDLTGTLTGTLTFAPGEGAKTFTVATTGDEVDEPDETFTVTLSNLSNARLTGGAATGTIEDDDDPPTLSVADASGSEGGDITFTATLAAASGKPVTATWTASVESGDTTASGDLSGTLTGTLTFAAGEATKTFTVATAEDTTDEDDETFTVTLSGPANATLGDATATGTIEDDDDPPTLRVADASRSEGGDVAFTATSPSRRRCRRRAGSR